MAALTYRGIKISASMSKLRGASTWKKAARAKGHKGVSRPRMVR